MSADIVLELRQATQKYAGVPAIENVDFQLLRGEIHALVGENGACKSTLTKVMAGVVPLSSGQMLVEGREVQLARRSSRASRASRWCSRRPAWRRA
jgi:simple sugar transport system ATP-binding protein